MSNMRKNLKWQLEHPMVDDMNRHLYFKQGDKKYIIYMLQFCNTRYVGQTQNLKQRLNGHKSAYKHAYERTQTKSHNGYCSLYTALKELNFNPIDWDMFVTVRVLAVTNDKLHANKLENEMIYNCQAINKQNNKTCSGKKVDLHFNIY